MTGIDGSAGTGKIAGALTGNDGSAGTERQEVSRNKSKGGRNDRSNLLLDLVSLILRILWILLFLGIAYCFVFGITVNCGSAMAPSFHDRDICIYYKLYDRLVSGDVVVYEDESGESCLGRVVAVPGDSVNFTAEGLRINGYGHTNEYGSDEFVLFEEGPEYPVTLAEGQFFILCDDRTQGKDSRLYGPLTQKEIRGRVMLTMRQRNF